ncbi:MAG: ATP-binding cassette domain-containing protein, partial [Pseudomonadota bacterium]
MLEFQDVRIVQGTFTLLADFTVPAGRKVAVIGPSGAGKSTLLAALGGFVPLARGRILCGGEDISETPPGARPLSMLFQDSNLFPHLTVRQNVGLGVNARLRLSADEMSQVDEALARVGLAGFEARRPGALSGGQQSRVALARVLVQRNPVLLLDEPFSA